MKRVVVGLAALGAIVAVAAIGQERGLPDPDSPFRDGRGGRGAMTAGDREAFVEARIAALRAGLRLTSDQEKLWPPVEAALRGIAKQRQDARAARRARWLAMPEDGVLNVPDQLRFAAERRAASAEALRRLADAISPLHGTLDEAQKRRLSVLARMLGPGRGMRRGALEGGSRDFAERGSGFLARAR